MQFPARSYIFFDTSVLTLPVSSGLDFLGVVLDYDDETGLVKVCPCVHHINIDINEAKIRSFIFFLF